MFVRLKKYNSYNFPDFIINEINKYRYVFNPSFIIHNDINYLLLRVFSDEKKKIESYLYCFNNNEIIDNKNLSEYFNNSEGINYVADPKVFLLNDEVWVTFNTGYVDSGNNHLCLLCLSNNEISKFYFCEFGERNRIEKNWAFYKEDNKLRVIYSLDPFTLLELKSKEAGQMVFEVLYKDEKQRYKDYTIGTPLSKSCSDYHFIAHKKFYFNGKRLYLGKPFAFSPLDRKVKAKRKYLFHSYKSLFGSKHKFNKNLISCTYFSGIYQENDNTILSYGINDTSWNIAKITNKKLWS